MPWNQAWRLGSDEATLLVNPHPLVIGSTTIPAGAHTLYLVPSDATFAAAYALVKGLTVPANRTVDVPDARGHCLEPGDQIVAIPTVVKLLPTEGDDYQYRIKSSGEAFERVAKESQLDRA